MLLVDVQEVGILLHFCRYLVRLIEQDFLIIYFSALLEYGAFKWV